MESHIKDLEAVRSLIQLYIDGANGDVAKLKQAFHPDARMMGHIGPMETYIPITDFFAMIERQPGMAGPNYKAFVRSIDLAGARGAAFRSYGMRRRRVSVARSWPPPTPDPIATPSARTGAPIPSIGPSRWPRGPWTRWCGPSS